MVKDYVEVRQNHRLARSQIEKFPENSVWVDVWHLADSGEGVFSICIRQSIPKFKAYWKKTKVLGYIRKNSVKSTIDTCRLIVKVLGIPIEDFGFYGSNLGNTEWLQKLLKEKEA